MRKRVADFADAFPVNSIELGSDARLPADYAAGHALGATYTLKALPTESNLRSDLQSIARAYRALTYRGVIDTDPDGQMNLADDFGMPAQTSIMEIRKYAFHRKVERNRTAARFAKKVHGSRCQACDLDFTERYDDIGKDFIEAHHLRPIASLEEGDTGQI
jgi:5-methylcytosine-specific restriction protein A